MSYKKDTNPTFRFLWAVCLLTVYDLRVSVATVLMGPDRYDDHRMM